MHVCVRMFAQYACENVCVCEHVFVFVCPVETTCVHACVNILLLTCPSPQDLDTEAVLKPSRTKLHLSKAAQLSFSEYHRVKQWLNVG